MANVQEAFEKAKKGFPGAWVSNLGPEWEEVPHTWQLVDAVAASFRCPEREGMLVLQEWRPGSELPYNHWGFMINAATLRQELGI